MRSLKSFGAIGLLALALAASVGSASAPASVTQICSTVGSGDGKCTTGTEAEYSGLITATEVTTVLTSSITNVTCHWHLTLEPTGSTGTPGVAVHITQWILTACKTSSGTNCTATTKNLPYPGTITASTLTYSDAVGAGAKLECGFLINCEFLTKDAVAEVGHDDTAILKFNKIALTRSGGLCPSTAVFDAEADVTSPTGLTVDTVIG